MKTIRKYLLFAIIMVASVAVSAQITDGSNDINETKSSSMKDPSSFSYFGIHYAAPFKMADMGSYGYSWIVYGSGGFGMEWGMETNLGLVDIDYFTILTRLGIAYGSVISDNTLLSTSLCLEMCPYTDPFDDKTKLNFGVSLKPQLVFKAGINAGLSFNISELSDKISVGFVVGINF